MLGVFTSILLICAPVYKMQQCVDKETIIERNETIILKAVAILIVVISHYYRYTVSAGIEMLFVSSGYLGASLFCLLSSYGCTKSYLQKGFSTKYFTGKIKDVYIPFVFINAITVIFVRGGRIMSLKLSYTFWELN